MLLESEEQVKLKAEAGCLPVAESGSRPGVRVQEFGVLPPQNEAPRLHTRAEEQTGARETPQIATGWPDILLSRTEQLQICPSVMPVQPSGRR
jgi:hypothetical protein